MSLQRGSRAPIAGPCRRCAGLPPDQSRLLSLSGFCKEAQPGIRLDDRHRHAAAFHGPPPGQYLSARAVQQLAWQDRKDHVWNTKKFNCYSMKD